MRLRTVAAVAVVLVVGVAVTAVAIVTNMDFSQYKGLIEQKAKEATGRDLKIGGDLKVVVGLSPALAVSDVSFANAPWGTKPQMVEARRFEAQVDLIPLLSGTVRVRRLVLLEPNILLETDARGRGNWEFDTAGGAPAPTQQPSPSSSSGPVNLPQINEVEIRNATLVYRDGKTRETKTVTLARASLKADNENAPLKLDIDGVVDNIRLQVTGEVGSVAALGSPGTAFPINVTARVPDVVTVRVQGQATEPLAGRGYDLRINAEAGEIAKVAELAGVRLPAIGPLKAALRVNDTAPGRQPSLPEINVEAGRPELALVKITGAVRHPMAQQGVAVDVAVEGREIGNFSNLSVPGLPQPLPPVPALGPFRAAVKAASQGERLALPSVKLELGREDLLHLTVDGAVQDPLNRRGFALTIAGQARDLAAVAKVLNTSAPLDGPLSLSGRIADSGVDRYALSNLRFAAAGSDLAGEGTLSLAGAKPAVTANLASNVIDIDKLTPRGPKPAAPAPPASRPAPGGASTGDGKVFPADPLPFELLNAADAELRYRAETIRLPQGPTVRQASVQVSLRGGELAVRPLTGDLATGKITGDISLSSRTGAAAIKLNARGIDLGALDKEVPGDDLVTGGKTDADIDLRGTGRSLRAIAASLDGSVFVSTGSGTFASRYTDVIGLGDLIEVISKSLPKQDRAQLNCLVGKFDVQGGNAQVRTLLVDTQRLTLDGSGSINLASERPDILLNTHTKVTSLLSLLPPIRVGGTLGNPSFFPDVGAGAVGAVGNVLGGILSAPGRIGGAVTGQTRPAADLCAQALARATGRPAPAQTAPVQSPNTGSPTSPAPGATPSSPPSPAGNPLDEIGRGIRGIFGR